MKTQTLSEQAREKRKEYYRKWRQKPENKEKALEYQKRYWERVAKETEAVENVS